METHEETPPAVTGQDDAPGEAQPWWRRYRSVILIGLIFVPACMVYTLHYFPEIGVVKGVITGVFFGLFCTMCAASGRVFW